MSNASATFLYQTAFTGPCKPKGARTYRALVIAPRGLQMTTEEVGLPNVPVASATLVRPLAAGEPTQQVTCPASATAGDSIRITGPTGRSFEVVVPEGISGGMQFEVEAPHEQQPVHAGDER